MPSNKSPLRPVALLFLAALLLAAAEFARDAERKIVGPLAVATHGDQVVVAAPGVLYRLDMNGTLRGTDKDVLDPSARDAGLAWLGDDLLASPGRDGALLRCSGNTCAPFTNDPYAPHGPVQVAMAAPDRIWLLETDADRAQRFFIDGRRIDMPLSDLDHPGALWQQDDLLYVCDTGKNALERHPLFKRGIAGPETVAHFPAAADDPDPATRPLRLLPHNGTLRVVLTNGARTQGRIADVGLDGSVRMLATPGIVSPVSLAESGDAVLVVDEDRMQVLKMDDLGHATPFGDAAFRAAIAAQVWKRDALRIAFPVLAVLVTLLLAIGGTWLAVRLLGAPGDPARPVAPGADGIAWFPHAAVNAPHAAIHRALAAAPAALVAAGAAGMLGHGTIAVAVALLVPLVAVLPVLLAGARLPRSGARIGLHGKLLVIADPERGMNEYRVAQVAWNARMLQPDGGTAIPFAHDGVDCFHRPTLEASLFPALDPARRVPD